MAKQCRIDIKHLFSLYVCCLHCIKFQLRVNKKLCIALRTKMYESPKSREKTVF